MLSETDQGEIRTAYRQAKDQRRQVEILSQLYAAPKEVILNVLGLEEIPQAVRRKTRPTKTDRHVWTDDVRQAVVARVLSGESHQQAGKAFGVPKNTVTGWMMTWSRTHSGGKST